MRTAKSVFAGHPLERIVSLINCLKVQIHECGRPYKGHPKRWVMFYMTNIIRMTRGYLRVSKAVDESNNRDTQLMLLAEHGIRPDLVYSDSASGRNLQRPGWQELITRVQEGETIVVAFLDRLSRNFEDGVRIQAELTRRNIGIVAIGGNIDTREGSAAAKFFRRSMLAQGAYQ